MFDGWFLVHCCYYITTVWVTSKLKLFFKIASDFYLGFVREVLKRRFTTRNVSAGNKSRVEWTCKGRFTHSRPCPCRADQTPPIQSDKYQCRIDTAIFSWWWAHGCPKHIEKRNKISTLNRIVHLVVFIYERFEILVKSVLISLDCFQCGRHLQKVSCTLEADVTSSGIQQHICTDIVLLWR